jgi:hypothetical protein
MTDLVITDANVLPGTFDPPRFKTVLTDVAFTPAQPWYRDATTSQARLAQADSTAAEAACLGISLDTAAAGQPIVYADDGSVLFGAILTAGTAYFVSATAGGIAPSGDLVQDDYQTLLLYAISTTEGVFCLSVSGQQVP